MLIVLSAYVAADIGFIASEKFPVVDDFFYSRQFPIKGGNLSDIVIVGIDNNSMFKFGKLHYKRSVFAEAFCKILEGGPKVIAVDIFFDGVRDLKDDLRFINTLNNTNSNIVLAIYVKETKKLLLNNDNITSNGYFNNNELITPGNVQGIIAKSAYGGMTKLKLNPQFDELMTMYYPLPIAALSKYYNAEIDTLPIVTDKFQDRYMYINYIGGLEAFNVVPFEKVSHINPEIFKNKIVLVGVIGQTMEDFHPTPLSDKTPGIVIHANVIHTIINKRFISPLRQSYQRGCVFIAAIVVFLLFYYAKTKFSIPAAFVILLIVKLTIDYLFSRHGQYIQFFPFTLSAAFVSLFAVIFREKNHLIQPC
ncbi:MAG: CHASE2 domain-containing protein [Candidatus Magnetominusculus sp. LBB02]|nr:CHASE2 domain-containing protein [Candidatus Magnetominusculus sp. LBB02]